VGGNNSFDWRITRRPHFWLHRQGPPMLTAEDVVKRIAVGCAFVETGAPWAFG